MKVGFDSLIVRVDAVAHPWAECRDSFGKLRRVRTDIRRGGGRIPLAGETWWVDRALGEEWTFAALHVPEGGASPIAQAPAGVIWTYAGAVAPTGFLFCDGSAVSRDTYAGLFAVIGETYGAGDGSTTFNLPNFQGRVPVGEGTLGSDTYALGDSGGEARHTLTEAETPSHTHSGPSHTHTMGTHVHTMGTHVHTMPSHSHSMTHSHSVDPPNTNTGNISANHSHAVGTGGSAHHHEGRLRFFSQGTGNVEFWTAVEPPGAGTTKVDRITDGIVEGPHGHGNTGNVSSNHNHAVNIGAFTSGGSSSSSTSSVDPGNTHATDPGNTNATDPGDTNAGGTAETGAKGGGAAHENRQPYVTVNYIISIGLAA